VSYATPAVSDNGPGATVIIANQTTCQITDQNRANNSCQCPLLPMGSKR